MRNSFFNNHSINTTIKNNLENKLKNYKKIKYVYAVMSKSNPINMITISNQKEWFQIYKENNFQLIDPVVTTALHRITPFPWDDHVLLSEGVKSLSFFDTARKNDIDNGYTFTLHDQYNNLAMLSIFSDNNYEDDIENIIQIDKDKIQMLLMLTHEKLIHFYQQLSFNGKFKKMNNEQAFSNRENEIIYWVSIGKSYQEVAMIIGVKLTTVKYHIANLVKKLGVNNAKHAIRLGIELQLIRPVFPRSDENHQDK